MSVSTLLLRVSLAVLTTGVLAACGSDGSPAGSAPPGSTSASPSSPTALPTQAVVARFTPNTCGTGARELTLDGPTGYRIDTLALGSGPTAAVFMHEKGGGTGSCGFWEYARWLTAHYPVQAVLVNRCNYGTTTCDGDLQGDALISALTQPAVDYARAHGATRVVLVGASAGATDAIEAAGVLSGVNGLVALSADITDTGGAAAPQRVRVPTLYAVAPDDGLCPLPQARATYAQIAGTPKRFFLDPAPSEHGWSMLTDGVQEVYAAGLLTANWILARYST